MTGGNRSTSVPSSRRAVMTLVKPSMDLFEQSGARNDAIGARRTHERLGDRIEPILGELIHARGLVTEQGWYVDQQQRTCGIGKYAVVVDHDRG